MKKSLLTLLISTIFFLQCSKEQTDKQNLVQKNMKTKQDLHTFSNYNDVKTTHLNLNLKVNFDKKTLNGVVTFNIENLTNAPSLILDCKDLTISKVTLNKDNKETTFTISESHPIFGSSLTINIDKNTTLVNVYYETNPSSEALQWLNAQQTAGKTHPFLFTQGEAILTRTWIPCQDSPENKITYSARIDVPVDMLAVMSAENLNAKNNYGIYEFKMQQPIATYLIALAVGNLDFKSIDYRTAVYAEPITLKAAAYEFEDMGKMLEVAEKLFGKYAWGRYDVIVLPPSFPFGGMENPRLTFATPTIIAGDKSLTALIAHEMAHSWSGNLVTNASWNDFWLNEGFTVYIERRIMEELYGKDYSDMLAELGKQDLMNTLNDLKENNIDDTKLKLNLKDRNPDDGMTDIAYEKGAHFLTLLENTVGREKFDTFITNYFQYFRFKSITTEEFVTYLTTQLLEPNKISLNINEWMYENGLPENCPTITSTRFQNVENQLANWFAKKNIETTNWTTHEYLHFIRKLPKKLSLEEMKKLDTQFNFTNSKNSEIAAAWFEHCIDNRYEKSYPQIEDFLINVGRRKFVAPLYEKMKETGDLMPMAQGIYKKARPNYHFITTNTVDDLLQ